MNKIAVCVPTYNRPDKIWEVLEKEIGFLQRHDVDMHIFDSSENAETRKNITEYSQYKNLYYHEIASDIRSNAKVFYIYQEYARQYEYIWVIHDHTVFTEDALCYILEHLEEDISYYFLEIQSHAYAWEDVTDLEQLLYETAWLSGRFGTVIVRSTPFLCDVDWKYFNRKYLTETMWNYSHIGFYFERASQVTDFRARIIKFPRDLFSDISRSQKTGWYRDSIRICLECWGEVISSLPECYTNKREVLRTQDKWFISKYSLITYKRNKVYGIRQYWNYRKWIQIIAPDEKRNAFLIAFLPNFVSQRLYTGRLISVIKRMRSEGRKICIYGAGRHAIECMDYLEACGVGIDAFLVTKKEGNPERIRSYPVYQADTYVHDKKVFVIIAIMSDQIREIKAYLDFLKENSAIQYMEFV